MSWVPPQARDVGRKWWDGSRRGDSSSLRPRGLQGSKIWTAARTNAEPFGKPFQSLMEKPENKEVQEGTDDARPPGEPWPWAGSSNPCGQVAHSILLCYHNSLWTLRSLDFCSPGVWNITKMNGGKKWGEELENSSKSLNLCMWSTFWGWNE